MKRWILVVAALLFSAAMFAQTATPTATNTPTNTNTPSNTPTPSHTPTVTPAPAMPVVVLTIAAGQTDSNAAVLGEGQVFFVTIIPPAAVDGTVTVQTSDTQTSPTWQTLQDAGSDVTVTAAKNRVISEVGAALLRIHESSSAASARTYKVIAVRKWN